MPSHETAKQETHKLRWTNNAGLNHSSCAVPIVPPRHPNTTREIQKWSNAYKYIMFGAVAVEKRSAICRSNRSLFVLVGNPGVIWHPASSQCVHTKLDTTQLSNGVGGGPDVLVTFQTLSTSYDCELDNPNLAFFKYDKNKLQWLSYLADVDVNTGQREEWCVRNSYAGTIQVHPECNSPGLAYESFFHEFL